METRGTRFKEIMLDVLLADPITVKGKGALTSLGLSISESEFLCMSNRSHCITIFRTKL